MKILLETTEQESQSLLTNIRQLLCRLLDCSKCNPAPGFLLLVEGVDEPIPKEIMRIKLVKPLKPGFRRPLTLKPDEAVDARADGSFAAVEVVEGDSTASVRTESTASQIELYINGDGSTGDKVVNVKADGHIGEGEVEISLEIAYTVAHPDATEFGPVTEGVDEPIPA